MSASGIAVAVLLALAVLSAWLGCFGFLRLKTALDRLHCVAFVNASVGVAVTAAIFVQDGLSTRSLKTLAILVVVLVAGAATTHAAARALAVRGEADR